MVLATWWRIATCCGACNLVEACDAGAGRAQSSAVPGSQPVSLARANWEMLVSQRFWVTWKADGTRYMLFICKWGVYTIDRAFRVRRTQMRFINPRSGMG